MKRKIGISFLCLAFLLSLATGCGKEENSTQENNQKENEVADTKIFEYLDKIEITDNLEKVNEVVGFDGTLDNEGNGWKKYTWKITENTSLIVTFYESSKKCDIKLDFDDELIKNDKVDFSKYEEVSKALKGGEKLTYEDIKEKFGGVDGTQIEKGYVSNKFRWVNSNGGYLNATFSTSSGKCTTIIGRI